MSFGRPGNFTDSFNASPPEKGSFPLDHDHDCTPVMRRYLACLRKNESKNEKCRELSRDYLQCRFDNNLMEKSDWPSLGFPERSVAQAAAAAAAGGGPMPAASAQSPSITSQPLPKPL